MHTHHLQEYKVWTISVSVKCLICMLKTNLLIDLWPFLSPTTSIITCWRKSICHLLTCYHAQAQRQFDWIESDASLTELTCLFLHMEAHTRLDVVSSWSMQVSVICLPFMNWLDGSCMHIIYPDLLKAFLSLHNLSAEEIIHCCSHVFFYFHLFLLWPPVQRG